MKKKGHFAFLMLLFVYCAAGCAPKTKTIELGEMPAVKTATFDNIYITDENKCKDLELPITRFAIEYPDNVEVSFPMNRRDHIIIRVKKGNEIIEELSIGNSTIKRPFREKSSEVLEGLVKDFQSKININVDSIGKRGFKGVLEYQFRGEYDLSEFNSQGYYGRYKIIVLIPFPETNDNLNAIIVSFLANENSEIKDFEDFENKGIISKIWNTFRYIE